MSTRAVIFSFDGVLADTGNVHVAAWQRTFRVMGWNESDETCARAALTDDRAFVAEVFARRQIEGGDLAGWASRKQALTLQLLRDRPHLQPGAAALVHALKEAGVALAVATTGPRAHVEAVLAASGLLDAFDLVAAIRDDGAGSSLVGPAGYRGAAESLGVDPTNVVALTRSTDEADAAAQAGLRGIVVADPIDDLARGAGGQAGFADLAATLATLGL